MKYANDPRYKHIFMSIFAAYLIDVTWQILPELVSMIQHEKPDLIVYDSISVHSKYLMDYLKKTSGAFVPPASIVFSPTFTFQENVYPNDYERQFTQEKHTWSYYIFFMRACFKQLLLSYKYGFKLNHPIKYVSRNDQAALNLVAIFPELQARSHLCNERVKFVGSCINERVRAVQSLNLDKPLLSIFSLFEQKNPINLDLDDYFLTSKSVLNLMQKD